MKGDFSRQTFDPTKHYSRVLMQQGRVQVDADWNEQQEIHQHRITTETRDVIGLCGAPLDNAGFMITVQPDNTLLFSKGRYYVDGILCENEHDFAYAQQLYLPNVSQPDIVKLLNDNKTLWAFVYLDVWQRHVTALDDAHIREVALNGPDTATRLQTIWQVGVLPIALNTDIEALRERLIALLARRARIEQQRMAPEEKKKALAEIDKEIEPISQAIARFSSQITCLTQSNEWNNLVAPSTGMLKVRTEPVSPTNDPCLIPPTAGYKGLENQLYRVEVHLPGDSSGGMTFKWSRENGSVVTTITGISGNTISVHDIGPDDVLGFAAGQWVEIIDDEIELKGLPGQLVQITQQPDRARLIITVSDAPTKVFDNSLHPKLRRWEQSGTSATKNGVSATFAPTWLTLEDGVQIQFSEGSYKTGDYWFFPARTVTGDIEWPQQGGNPMTQPPLGIQHHYCRLGLLRYDLHDEHLHVCDCRVRFPPLASRALHVLATNWLNDDLFSPAQFLEQGLRIMLDATPAQLPVGAVPDERSVGISSPATVIVSLEYPGNLLFRTDAIDASFFDVCVLLHGTTRVEQNVIVWQLERQSLNATLLGADRINVSALAARQGTVPRVRVVLKGHTIWRDQGEQRYYLDGQAFGQPDVRSDKVTPCNALRLPSGMGALASDFESWFYLGEPKAAVPPKITKVSFVSVVPGTPTNPPDATIVTVDLTHGLPAQKTQFGDASGVDAIDITFSRPVRPDGLTVSSPKKSVFVTFVAAGTPTADVTGDLYILPNTNNTVVRFITRDFQAADYQLTVLGTDNPNRGPAVRALDDATALDGDYDGKPGGNFVLPFSVFIQIT